jgi:hypothetical protein
LRPERVRRRESRMSKADIHLVDETDAIENQFRSAMPAA